MQQYLRLAALYRFTQLGCTRVTFILKRVCVDAVSVFCAALPPLTLTRVSSAARLSVYAFEFCYPDGCFRVADCADTGGILESKVKQDT